MSKKYKLLILGIPVVLGIGLAVYLNISGRDYIRLWPCPLFEAFGLACPGCGGTRCVSSILTLHFLAAIQYNLLVFILFFLFAGVYVYCVYKVIRFNKFVKIPGWCLWGAGAVVVAFTIIRNLPFYPWLLLESPWAAFLRF